MRLRFVFHSTLYLFVISGFRRELDENCALLGYHAASSGNFLPTFRDNLSIPFSRVKKTGPMDCPETSVRNHHYSLRDDPEERSSLCLFICLFDSQHFGRTDCEPPAVVTRTVDMLHIIIMTQ